MDGSAYVPPKWKKPSPLGYGSATESVGGVAAPLLAGFSFSAMLVVAADRDHFRWPGLTTLLFTCSTLLLITAVQSWFRARKYLWSPADVATWWPDMNEEREAELRLEQAAGFASWSRWAAVQNFVFNAGILGLLAGVATALVPASGAPQGGLRWLAAGLVALCFVAECGFSLVERWRS